MTTRRYFALLTHQGEQKLAQAAALGKPLSITRMAVGDGHGQLPAPDPAQTTLVNERRRGALNSLTTDKNNPEQLIAEQVIPETEGGFWIREIGLYDKDGCLIAAGNCPETYKPQMAEGSGRTQILRMVLVVSHTDAVTLKIDPSTVLATREYADNLIKTQDTKLQQQLKDYIPHKAKSDAVTSGSSATVATSKAVKKVRDIAAQKYTAQDATTKNKGIVRLSNAADSDDETKAATPKALKQVYELAQKQYVPQDATTTRKGVVQLSSATDSTGETKAATPKAVWAAMREAKNKQPAGNYALTGDSHSKQEALNLFLQKNRHGADITDKNAFVRNLGLSETVKQAKNAVPNTRMINGKTLKQNLTLTAADIGAYSREETNKTFLPVNSRQAVTLGKLVIDNGTDWPVLRYKASNGYLIGIEGSQGQALTIFADDPQGKRRYNLSTPQKSGTLATLEDIAVPAGAPVPWPQATPPSGYLACSGQTFNKSVYPKLGTAYPSGKLPDLRSEFIRGLYSGRPALSLQRGAVERHKHIGGLGENGGDHFGKTSTSGHFGLGKADWDNPLQYTNNGDTWNGNHPNPAGVISNETRPRNIAFLYIVRAV